MPFVLDWWIVSNSVQVKFGTQSNCLISSSKKINHLLTFKDTPLARCILSNDKTGSVGELLSNTGLCVIKTNYGPRCQTI